MVNPTSGKSLRELETLYERNTEQNAMKDVRDLLKSRALTRYIRAQVGRPWDKVYSELCSMADSRSDIGKQVRDIIRWNVETNCVIEDDGEIVSYLSRWFDRRPVDGLFVHPKTGILCYADRESYHGTWAQPRSWERDIDYIALADLYRDWENKFFAY